MDGKGKENVLQANLARIRHEMALQGVTAHELAKRLRGRVGRPTIYRYTRRPPGVKDPKWRVIEQLCWALSIEPLDHGSGYPEGEGLACEPETTYHHHLLERAGGAQRLRALCARLAGLDEAGKEAVFQFLNIR